MGIFVDGLRMMADDEGLAIGMACNALADAADKIEALEVELEASKTPNTTRRIIKYNLLCHVCMHGETIQWVDDETGLLNVECCSCHEVGEYANTSNPVVRGATESRTSRTGCSASESDGQNERKR